MFRLCNYKTNKVQELREKNTNVHGCIQAFSTRGNAQETEKIKRKKKAADNIGPFGGVNERKEPRANEKIISRALTI